MWKPKSPLGILIHYSSRVFNFKSSIPRSDLCCSILHLSCEKVEWTNLINLVQYYKQNRWSVRTINRYWFYYTHNSNNWSIICIKTSLKSKKTMFQLHPRSPPIELFQLSDTPLVLPLLDSWLVFSGNGKHTALPFQQLSEQS